MPPSHVSALLYERESRVYPVDDAVAVRWAIHVAMTDQRAPCAGICLELLWAEILTGERRPRRLGSMVGGIYD